MFLTDEGIYVCGHNSYNLLGVENKNISCKLNNHIVALKNCHFSKQNYQKYRMFVNPKIKEIIKIMLLLRLPIVPDVIFEIFGYLEL